ncbi:hypothetical protein PInf_002110 [Phytophthora infestans]|nr:hypothetical protein PInf_002110 [Phytophthora infestans]
MPKPTTDASWEVEVSNKTGQPIRWNDQNFQYYKKLTEITARDAGLYNVKSEQIKYDEIFTSMQKANDPTKAMTKRQLYAQLESAKCKQNGKVEAHLNYMCRRKGRLKTVGFVDAGMDCVDTPEKVVSMAVTF